MRAGALAAASVAFAIGMVSATRAASAFCGFYVAGADAKLFNDATQVVLMREGTRTVLSMRNAYKGPPENFAMVVPVPVVLQKDDVKTLTEELFDRVDSLGAPRLVEYWEMDPCEPQYEKKFRLKGAAVPSSEPVDKSSSEDTGVVVEAQFVVGEYEVVILSAKDSGGLETWLKANKYSIPAGAEPYLRPYVEAGSKFFVAKVDAQKVKFVGGRAMLSPLRFHYDTNEFTLPVRLGLMNSQGTQDLIVNILARGKRYEVANYPNVTIPTNLDLRDEAKGRFGEFYAALFDRTIAKTAKAVVTEYSWDASSCDPCPLPALTEAELQTLGADVVTGYGGFVLTRLHARYGADGQDLVFKEAESIGGGREWRGADGKLEERAQPTSQNMFQARYAIRHPWTGDMKCESPIRGQWGGPPASVAANSAPVAAKDLAFVSRGAKLAALVAQDVPEIDLKAGEEEPKADAKEPTAAAPAAPAATPPVKKEKKGCSVAGDGDCALFGFGLLAILLWRRRRRG